MVVVNWVVVVLCGDVCDWWCVVDCDFFVGELIC